MGHKGHYGQYSGNAKWSRNHAHTKVTKENYKASERDDAAHIDYLKRDIDYDNKHGHSDENMTADEKHISKLAGDMKYDKEHHDSPGKMVVPNTGVVDKFKKDTDKIINRSSKVFDNFYVSPGWSPKDAKQDAKQYTRLRDPAIGKVGAPTKHVNKHMDKNHPHNKRKDHDESIHSHKGKK